MRSLLPTVSGKIIVSSAYSRRSVGLSSVFPCICWIGFVCFVSSSYVFRGDSWSFLWSWCSCCPNCCFRLSEYFELSPDFACEIFIDFLLLFLPVFGGLLALYSFRWKRERRKLGRRAQRILSNRKHETAAPGAEWNRPIATPPLLPRAKNLHIWRFRNGYPLYR